MFVSAVNQLIGHYVSQGNRRAALRVINNTLSTDGISETTRAFFTKGRAQINYSFQEYDKAQTDIDYILSVLHNDAETLALQTKIWAAQEQNMEQANDYAMLLIRNSPADMMAWDTLGRVVAVREGADAALEVLERVGEVSETCSSLFEFLGDLYSQTGDMDKAVQSYKRAIELSDDGLVVVPYIEKKLRKMK